MSFPKKVLLGSLFALSTNSAFAVDTADLSVVGTIAPTACTPTFAGGGVIDYGLISSASLSATEPTPLAPRTVKYTIACDAPIAIGTSWVDGRSSSTVGTNGSFFGLGKQGEADIGQYTITQLLDGATGDGAAVDLIGRDSGTGPWVKAVSGIQLRSNVRVHAFAAPGTLVPTAFTNMSGTIQVNPIISATSTLDLTTSIELDGLSTMTVRYL